MKQRWLIGELAKMFDVSTDTLRYYEGFEMYYKNGDSAPMVKMIAQYIEEQLNLDLRILAAYSAP